MDKTVSITAHWQGNGKELVSSSLTLALLMSKLRSSLEAGKKQPRVWIEYVCSVAKMILYSSFGAPSVFLYSLYGGSEWVLGRAKRQSRARRRLEGNKRNKTLLTDEGLYTDWN